MASNEQPSQQKSQTGQTSIGEQTRVSSDPRPVVKPAGRGTVDRQAQVRPDPRPVVRKSDE